MSLQGCLYDGDLPILTFVTGSFSLSIIARICAAHASMTRRRFFGRLFITSRWEIIVYSPALRLSPL
jgi:hypothetical protein